MTERLVWKNGRFVGLVQVDETQAKPYMAIDKEGRQICSFKTEQAAEYCCHGDVVIRERKVQLEA